MYDDDFEIEYGDPHQDYWYEDDFEIYNQNEADDYRYELEGPYYDDEGIDDYCERCGWVPCVCDELQSELNEGGDVDDR